jgi:GGDEF domain-containing protein
VSDPLDDPTPPSAAPRSAPKRARKFVLPDAHHDERTATRIEAFIDGPPELRLRRQGPFVERERNPVELDTRTDWFDALRHEAARHARYGRPASVLVVELPGGLGDVAYDRMARQLTDIIRAEVRDPDRAVRIGRSRFQLLLPETSSRAAQSAAERLQRAFLVAQGSSSAFRPGLQIEIATPHRTESLESAVQLAEARLRT